MTNTYRKIHAFAGLGQFGFGDGTFRRWWSQMFYTKKVCFRNTWKV